MNYDHRGSEPPFVPANSRAMDPQATLAHANCICIKRITTYIRADERAGALSFGCRNASVLQAEAGWDC